MHSTIIRLLAGAALFGSVPIAAHAAFVAAPGGLPAGTGLNFVTFTDAVSTTYAPGTPAVYTSGGRTTTFTSGSTLERDQSDTTYLDNNFAPGTQLIGPCGYTSFSSPCIASGTLVITFSVPTAGFTASVDDFDTSTVQTFTARVFNGTSLLGTVSASSLADNGQPPAILAAFSDTPITSVVIGGGDGNFAVGAVGTVPEPRSIALLATTLLLVGGLLRRRG